MVKEKAKVGQGVNELMSMTEGVLQKWQPQLNRAYGGSAGDGVLTYMNTTTPSTSYNASNVIVTAGGENVLGTAYGKALDG